MRDTILRIDRISSARVPCFSHLTSQSFMTIESELELVVLDREIWHLLCHENDGYLRLLVVGLGDLGVPCSPRDPWFAGSTPAEVDGDCQDVKIPSTSPPGVT